MYILKTSIFDEFKCIADKCPYTCCKDWSIAVEEETLKKYIKLGIKVRLNEDGTKAEMPIDNEDKCIYLDECGLCSIVKERGEEYLSYTCRMFPRMSTEYENCIEFTVSNACPVVLDILNNLGKSLTFADEEMGNSRIISDKGNINLRDDRNQIIDLLQISEFPLTYRLYIAFLFAWKLRAANDEKNRIRDNFNNVDFIVRLYNLLDKKSISLDKSFEYKMMFLDNIPQLFKKNKTYQDIYISVKKDIENISAAEYMDKYMQFENEMCNYDMFFENFMVNMFFSKGCLDYKYGDALLFNIITLFLEMTLVRLHLFLLWLKNSQEINFEDVKTISCFYARNMEQGLKSVQRLLDKYIKDGIIDEGMMLLLV